MFKVSKKLLIVGILLWCLIGCASSKPSQKIDKIQGNQLPITHLNKGDIAPHDGWLMGDDDIKVLYKEAIRGVEV